MGSVPRLAYLCVLTHLYAWVPGTAQAWEPIHSSRPRWDMSIPIDIHLPGSRDLGIVDTLQLVRDAAAVWSEVDCGVVDFESTGFTTNEVDLLEADGLSALEWIEEDWQARTGLGEEFVAYTVIHFMEGAITEADIAFNGEHYVWSMAPRVGTNEVDAPTVVRHELGHYLGLGHSLNPSALLAGGFPASEVRVLTFDDADGLCALYQEPQGAPCGAGRCEFGDTCVDGSCTVPSPTCELCGDGLSCPGEATACLPYPDGSQRCAATCDTADDCGVDETCAVVIDDRNYCVRLNALGQRSCDTPLEDEVGAGQTRLMTGGVSCSAGGGRTGSMTWILAAILLGAAWQRPRAGRKASRSRYHLRSNSRTYIDLKT